MWVCARERKRERERERERETDKGEPDFVTKSHDWNEESFFRQDDLFAAAEAEAEAETETETIPLLHDDVTDRSMN